MLLLLGNLSNSARDADGFSGLTCRAETLAAVWLRVQGLQGAVKKTLAARDAAALAPPKPAGFSAGRRKPPPRGVAVAQGALACAAQAG